MPDINKEFLLYLLGAVGIWVLLRFFGKPIRFLLRMVISSVFGGILLLLLNTFGASCGIYLAVNPVTAFLGGVLGVPGVLAMLFIKLWL